MQKKLKAAAFILILLGIVFLIFYLYGRYALPQAEVLTESAVLTHANICINKAVRDAAAAENNQISNICEIKYGENGNITSIKADGMAVNRFCGNLAQELSKMLADSESRVYISLGSLSGIAFLADKGPRIPVKINLSGGITADYDTQVKSLGINQAAFTLFINIHADIRAYNPVINNIISLDRKIMLADIVYSGPVPNIYGGGIAPNYR